MFAFGWLAKFSPFHAKIKSPGLFKVTDTLNSKIFEYIDYGYVYAKVICLLVLEIQLQRYFKICYNAVINSLKLF